jgi:hypothetical protein
MNKQKNIVDKNFLHRRNIPGQKNHPNRKEVGAAKTVKFSLPEKQNVQKGVVNFTFAKKTPAVTAQARNRNTKSNLPHLPYPIYAPIRLYLQQTSM